MWSRSKKIIPQISYFVLFLVFLPAVSFSQVSLSDIGPHESSGTDDPSVSREAAAPGAASTLQGLIGQCFPGRADFSAQGGYGRGGLAASISAPGPRLDSNPELAKGGTFTADQVKQSLIGLDGLSGQCARCHKTGSPKPLINASYVDSTAGRAAILKALTARTPPMPKDNPRFAATPEGIAVINFLRSQSAAAQSTN